MTSLALIVQKSERITVSVNGNGKRVSVRKRRVNDFQPRRRKGATATWIMVFFASSLSRDLVYVLLLAYREVGHLGLRRAPFDVGEPHHDHGDAQRHEDGQEAGEADGALVRGQAAAVVSAAASQGLPVWGMEA